MRFILILSIFVLLHSCQQGASPDKPLSEASYDHEQRFVSHDQSYAHADMRVAMLDSIKQKRPAKLADGQQMTEITDELLVFVKGMKADLIEAGGGRQADGLLSKPKDTLSVSAFMLKDGNAQVLRRVCNNYRKTVEGMVGDDMETYRQLSFRVFEDGMTDPQWPIFTFEGRNLEWAVGFLNNILNNAKRDEILFLARNSAYSFEDLFKQAVGTDNVTVTKEK